MKIFHIYSIFIGIIILSSSILLTQQIAFSQESSLNDLNSRSTKTIEQHNTINIEGVDYQLYSVVTNHVRYDIPYNIIGASISKIIQNCDSGGSVLIEIKVTNNEDGKLLIYLPRNLYDVKVNGIDDNLEVLANGEEIEYNKIETDLSYRIFLIPYTHETTEIEIIKQWDLEPSVSCKIIHDPPYSFILSPIMQSKLVDDRHEIICKNENHQLIFKKNLWTPACVSSTTAETLNQRGWSTGI